MEFWRLLQSRIFVSVAVGKGNAEIICTYEYEDGTKKQMLIGELITLLLDDLVGRFSLPILALFPGLYPYTVTSYCRRFKRNCMQARNALKSIIEERRKGLKLGSDGDLLDILLSNEIYQGNEEKTIDELIIFFMAGNETIKTSSANTTMFLTMHDYAKKRFMD